MAGIKYTPATLKALGVYYEFDKDVADGTILKKLKPGQTIVNIDVDVTTGFDAGFAISIGTPANHSQFVGATEVNLTQIRNTELNQYYIAAAETTVAIYVTGTSTGGVGTIFIEIL
jgi:hypothetical protein